MSTKHYKHYPDIFLNPYILIILILIVLQWFRVGSISTTPSDENFTTHLGLLNCGGLFIIVLFLLVYCNCANN